MRTNTLSINTNLQNDRKSSSFSIKKVMLCLCLVGALVIAGFRAPMAAASSQGCNQRQCDEDLTEIMLLDGSLCLAGTLLTGGDLVFGTVCSLDIAGAYAAGAQICNQCSP